MTAREYVTECTPLNAPNREKFIEAVTEMLQDFTTLKCKEQRENCAQNITFVGLQSSINVDYYTVNREQIRNAKQPEV